LIFSSQGKKEQKEEKKWNEKDDDTLDFQRAVTKYMPSEDTDA